MHPGELQQVSYLVRNTSDRTITGQAVPSVTPGQAAQHFEKIECFCFEQQTLAPGEAREMPLAFIVKPEVDRDIAHITLSYAFFSIEGQRQTLTSNKGRPDENQHCPGCVAGITTSFPSRASTRSSCRRDVPAGAWLHPGDEFNFSARQAGSCSAASAVILYVLFGWFGKVISESQSGAYRDWEDRSFRYGMIWFIAPK